VSLFEIELLHGPDSALMSLGLRAVKLITVKLIVYVN
jgi:hypothetical protein